MRTPQELRGALDAYVAEVLEGRRVVGRLELLAVQRHARDIKHGAERGLRFDPRLALRACWWIEARCRWSKGEWAGKPVVLEGWQIFIVASLFGWVRQDASGRWVRRFRDAYVSVARKNGKSEIAAMIALLMLVLCGEQGGEIYSAAPLSLSTRVPTPNGWSTMGDLAPGDHVFDELGRPVAVVGVSPVFDDRPCFAVVFDDGSEVVSDADHLWTVDSVHLGESKAGLPRGTRPRFGRTMTTAQIAATVRTPLGAANHRIDATGLDRLPDADLPIPPYTLGVWLGDGRQNRGCIVHAATDSQIVAAIEAEGETVSCHGAEPGLVRYTVLGLRGRLSRLGLLDAKRIPVEYLRASQQQRLDLLRGLLDTDGTCTKTGEVRFTNRNRALAEGVRHLMATLGLVPKLHSVEVAGAPHWVVSVRANGVPLFNLTRKSERQVAPTLRARRRRVVAVREVPSVPVRCIEVDSESGLFLVGETLIATHNTKRDQAAIVWRAAASIVRKSPELRREIALHDSRSNMVHGESESKFEAVSADADTLDGLGPILAVVDELHAHPDSSVYDVLESGMGARREPLRLAITTAGEKRHGVCWDTESDGVKILEGAYGDPAAGDDMFVFVARADEADDPFSEVSWAKANPNLGVSVHLDQLRVAARTAKRKPSALGEFERKRLNRWSESSNAWLTMPDWDACSEGFAPVRGAQCWVGMDLSATQDYTAACAVFRLDDGFVGVKPAFWIPEETLFDRQKTDRVPVAQWVKSGLVNVTSGNVVDQDAAKAWLVNLRERFDVVEVPMDPHNSTKLQTELDGLGFTVVAHRQGWVSMNPAIQESETLILKRKLRHGGNPVLRWMFSNVAIKTDSQKNRTFSKDRAGDRIDGIVAMAMGIGRAMISTGSAYDEHDVREVG